MAIEITSRSLTGPQSEETAVYKESRRIPVPATDKSVSRSRLWRPAPRWTRRNFSSRASELSGGKAIILSVPKSGRTWLRAFLCAYFCKRFGLEFTLRPERYDEPGIPRLVFSHDLGWYFLTICSSTGRKVLCGTDCGANIWCQEGSFAGQRSFCSCGIRAIVLFLSICS